MPIRKPVDKMTPDELRAFVTDLRKKQLERSQKAAARKKEEGQVRFTAYIPEGSREMVRKAVAEAVREYLRLTDWPLSSPSDEPEQA